MLKCLNILKRTLDATHYNILIMKFANPPESIKGWVQSLLSVRELGSNSYPNHNYLDVSPKVLLPGKCTYGKTYVKDKYGKYTSNSSERLAWIKNVQRILLDWTESPSLCPKRPTFSFPCCVSTFRRTGRSSAMAVSSD